MRRHTGKLQGRIDYSPRQPHPLFVTDHIRLTRPNATLSLPPDVIVKTPHRHSLDARLNQVIMGNGPPDKYHEYSRPDDSTSCPWHPPPAKYSVISPPALSSYQPHPFQRVGAHAQLCPFQHNLSITLFLPASHLLSTLLLSSSSLTVDDSHSTFGRAPAPAEPCCLTMRSSPRSHWSPTPHIFSLATDKRSQMEIESEEARHNDSRNTMRGTLGNSIGGEEEIWNTTLDIDDSLRDRDPEDLHNLGVSNRDQFRQTGELDCIQNAIKYASCALALTPYGHPHLAPRLASLGSSYDDRFRRLGEVDDVEKAIKYFICALVVTPDNHPDLPARLVDLSIAYTHRYKSLQEVQDLNLAIEYKSRLVQITSDDNQNLPRWVTSLGISYTERYKRLGETGDLERAIECDSRAVTLTPSGHPDLPSRLINLALSYEDRYERLNELRDLDRVIENRSRAVELTPSSRSEFPRRLAGLGSSYSSRFERLGKMVDLEEAIKYQFLAVESTSENDPSMAERLSNLGISYTNRHQRSGESGDLEKSIQHKSRALKLTPDSDPNLPDRLLGLGASYCDRYMLLNELNDLEKSIEYIDHAVDITPDGHSDLPNLLAGLGVCYTHRFERLGEIGDLEKAMGYKSRALNLTPKGHTDLPRRLCEIAVSCTQRYRRLGEIADLENAIEYDSRAVALTPEDHPEFPSQLGNLGASYEDRYLRLGEPDDLAKAIKYISRALELMPNDHQDVAAWCTGLGSCYADRYIRIGALSDLSKAIEYKERALRLTPDTHPRLPHQLANLASSYHDQYQRLKDLDDLQKAIELKSRGLALTPNGHPSLSGLLGDLGVYHDDRYRSLGEIVDLEKSDDYIARAASQSPEGHPSSSLRYFNWQIRSIRSAKPLKFSTGDHATYFTMPSAGQSWLPDITPSILWKPFAQQLIYFLSSSGWVPRPINNIKISHLQRIWPDEPLMLRTALDDLSTSFPDLANRLQRLARQLNEATSDPVGSDRVISTSVPEYRHALARRYNDLLAQVRELPGFENFLRPTRVDSLYCVARNGPVIIINCDTGRCDAIILIPGHRQVYYVPLPEFSRQEAQNARLEIQKSLNRWGLRERDIQLRPRPGRKQEQKGNFRAVLKLLWYGIVKPVLSFLGYLDVPIGSTIPHVTWCPTGAVSFLPLHAAGDYDKPDARSFKYVVSSYTPNLTTLLSSSSSALGPGSRVLGVGQEATSLSRHNLSKLPGTTRELGYLKEQVQKIKSVGFSELTDENATTKAVLDAMENHDWVHLACHAHQNVDDPSESGFLLHDGILDLASINRRSFKNKGLAFLSACQTATGDSKLPDEAVHLASGMLMAGYSSVIATMWSVKDADAPLVANEVYSQLMRDGKLGKGEAGRALHRAIAELRGKIGENEFGRWVPYIHIGS
ncbi:CHAT domain-containing protein [Rhizoctonia solani AG-1 IA]|uniref:CHAT domain-containing protein n=1 Tax=Thanatephorus cucumeris (strain AG1-IA) TaxID=983506 RepID=L8WK95_THACA|nr:CHAT domain-containing protein [Rhizoctonia solani AG-1 IA]